MAIKAVIFDFDGTLADTFPLIVSSFNAAVSGPLGLRFEDEEVISRFGVPDTVLVQQELPEELWETAVETYYSHYLREHGMVAAFEGVEEMLRDLSASGYPLGVVTGKGRRAGEISIAKLGWTGLFGSLVTGDDIENQKPHPEGVLRAASELGVSPEDCAYVGDSPVDVEAGGRAGALTFAAGWHARSRERLARAGATYWLDRPSELVDVIRRVGS
ncbi:MAG TPA: HAD-IA family hydrolase [Fimbriimonadaceae bacterium]|nr:HAD-IA family hydrolase [Fimbriimonadaceae bacterium]